MNIAFLPPHELDRVYSPSASGIAVMGCGVTELSPAAVELLFRLDGTSPLRAARDAMPGLAPADFARAFNALQDRDLVQPQSPDTFAADAAMQLGRLGITTSGDVGAGSARLSVGLVCSQPRRRVPDGRPMWAVVVEDDQILLRFLEHFLTLEGIHVRTASNKAEVVEVVRRGVPDLFLLDGSLPDVDGFDILRSVRKHPLLTAVPALMMTGRCKRQDVLEAFSSGAQGYLTKPVHADTLLGAVRAVLGLPAAQAADPWSNRDALPCRTPVAARAVHHLATP